MANNQSKQDSILLNIAAELRLKIFDALFKSLTERPKILDSYALPDEWPNNDFSSYTNLRSTWQQLYEESTAHFEKHYLSRAMFYFDQPGALYQLTERLKKCRPIYHNVRFSFRTTPYDVLLNEVSHFGNPPCVWRHHKFTLAFADAQKGVKDLHLASLDGFCSDSEICNCNYVLNVLVAEGHRGRATWHKGIRNSVNLDIVSFSGAGAGDGLDLQVRQICGKWRSAYAEVSGCIRNICWHGFDVADALSFSKQYTDVQSIVSKGCYDKGMRDIRKMLRSEQS